MLSFDFYNWDMMRRFGEKKSYFLQIFEVARLWAG